MTKRYTMKNKSGRRWVTLNIIPGDMWKSKDRAVWFSNYGTMWTLQVLWFEVFYFKSVSRNRPVAGGAR